MDRFRACLRATSRGGGEVVNSIRSIMSRDQIQVSILNTIVKTAKRLTTRG